MHRTFISCILRAAQARQSVGVLPKYPADLSEPVSCTTELVVSIGTSGPARQCFDDRCVDGICIVGRGKVSEPVWTTPFIFRNVHIEQKQGLLQSWEPVERSILEKEPLVVVVRSKELLKHGKAEA